MKKNWKIALIGIIFLSCHLNGFCGKTIYRVGTFNIRFFNSDTGDMNWQNRKTYVAQIILDYAYDVIALNEIYVGRQENDLKALLPDYTLITWGTNSAVVKGGGMNGVAFLTEKFELLDNGFFFLSADPDRPIKSWDAYAKSVTVYVKLRNKISDEVFYYFATHMTHQGIIAKREGARINIEKMNEIAGHYPTFLAGDLNSNPNNPTVYPTMWSYYQDSRVVAEIPYTLPDGTLGKWDKNNTSSTRIDYVWSNARILTYETIWEDYGRSVTPSDHFPLLVTCTLNEYQNNQHTFYVDADAPANGNGTKTSPFNNFSDALEASGIRDTIYLTQGTYYPSEAQYRPGRSATFEIKNSLLILGGYDSNFTEIVGKSVFSGDINRNDEYDSEGKITANNEDNAFSVLTINQRCIVEIHDCIISGGYADKSASIKGAGINNSGPYLKLNKVELYNNYAADSGGGIYSSGCIIIDNCVFMNNKAENQGGGFYISSNLWKNKVVNTTFSENSAERGSALYIAGLTEGYYSGNTFTGNRSKLYGTFTVIGEKQGDIVIVNNTFAGNILESQSSLYNASNGGAAIHINTVPESTIHLVNNTITGNVNICHDNNGDPATNFYGAAVHVNRGKVNLYNNIIAGNYSTSSTGGDVFIGTSNAELLDSQYNIYTFNGNITFTPDETDFLSVNYIAGLNALKKMLEGDVLDNMFIPKLTDNGGYTSTIKVLEPYYNEREINILGKAQLSETALKIDLDGNAIVSGNIEYDQRGIARDLNNKSTIGAFEYEYGSTIKSVVNPVWKIYVIDDEIHFSENCYYELFDMNGYLRKNGYTDVGTVSISFLHAGIYLIKTTMGNEVKVSRFIKK